MDRNSFEGASVFESRKVEIPKMNVPDFRSPPPGPMASTMQTRGDPFEVNSSTGEGPVWLPLKTPNHRLLSSDNKAMAEVRKRPLGSSSQSPPPGGDEKRRHVAKVLQFGGDVKMASKAARCLLGSPSEEKNAETLNSFNVQALKQYEEFSRRYEIIEEIERI